MRAPKKRPASRLPMALVLLLAVAVAEASSVPDPRRAFEDRDFAPVEAWLAEQPETDIESASVYRARAWRARRNGDDQRAREWIDRAVELEPGDADLRVDRAALQSVRLKDAGAFKSMRIARRLRRDLETALELDPGHPGALVALIRFHREAPGIVGGDADQAVPLMERLQQVSPSRHRLQLAVEAAEAGRFDAAVEEIRTALTAADQPPLEWHVLAGDWLARSSRPEEAFDAYRQALERAPGYAPALYALGMLSAETGMRKAAGIEALRSLTTSTPWPTDPPISAAWKLLARLYEASGQMEAAAAATARWQDLSADSAAAGDRSETASVR